jgi:hypothetical protein
MDTLSEHEIDVDDAEAGVCTAEPANLELDQFLVERRMRPIICRDVHLIILHSTKKPDKEAAFRCCMKTRIATRNFAHTYSIFIEIFEAMRDRLATFGLSSKGQGER